MKDGYKLDLEMPETMKLFGCTKNEQAKQGVENMYQVLEWLK